MCSPRSRCSAPGEPLEQSSKHFVQAGPRAPAHEVFTRKLKIRLKIKIKAQGLPGRTYGVRLLLDKWLAVARRACLCMVQTFDMSRRNNSTNESNNHSQGLDHHVETTEFDAIGQHVKKGRRGACRQKATTVLPNRTAAT